MSLATFLFQSVWSQWRRGNGLSVSPEHDVADRKWHHRSAWFVVYCQRRDFWTGKSAGPWLQVIFFVIAVLCLNVVIINTPSTSEEILFFWLWLRSVVKFAWYLSCWSTAPTTAQYRKVMGKNPSQAWSFFRRIFYNCLSCVHNCDDHWCLYIFLRNWNLRHFMYSLVRVFYQPEKVTEPFATVLQSRWKREEIPNHCILQFLWSQTCCHTIIAQNSVRRMSKRLPYHTHLLTNPTFPLHTLWEISIPC